MENNLGSALANAVLARTSPLAVRPNPLTTAPVPFRKKARSSRAAFGGFVVTRRCYRLLLFQETQLNQSGGERGIRTPTPITAFHSKTANFQQIRAFCLFTREPSNYNQLVTMLYLIRFILFTVVIDCECVSIGKL